MTFHDFCTRLSAIEKTSSRLEMTALLADLFNTLHRDDVEPACWLLLGRLAPLYVNLEFNFAEKMVMRVLAELDVSPTAKTDSKERLSSVLSLFKSYGDLGDVAEHLLHTRAEDTRSIPEVFNALLALAKEGGTGSQERKLQHMAEILRHSSGLTAKYTVRILLGTLRLGFSQMTLLDALSWAKTGDKSLRKPLELAYQMKADIGKLARVFLAEGEKGLDSFDIELGIPIAPALCQRLHTADEMIEKMGKVYVEPKYDGTRVSIHIKKSGKEWQIRTFTRNLEESSGMFPELATDQALDAIDADEIILDSEAVGDDPETDKLLPFQQTIQRKRKHDIEETAARVPLRFFVFDILYKNGKNLLHIPLHDRKKILEQTVKQGSVFVLAPYIITDSPKELREFHAKQLSAGLEGAVIKQYASEYQPGRRGWSWVKFKEEEGAVGKLSDTLDCIVMGYYKGQGKRAGFGVGAFLVGVRDEKSDTIRTVAKIGTGLSDDQWKELKTRAEKLTVKSQPKEYLVHENLIPDVWMRPALVVEVAADEVTNSPTHSAEKALRFPRLERFRDDKTPDQATTVKELRAI